MIRLLGRDTVEEIVYRRAASKLRLTNTVIEEGRFSLQDQAQSRFRIFTKHHVFVAQYKTVNLFCENTVG